MESYCNQPKSSLQVLQSFTGPAKQEQLKVYLLGNPAVWWLNLALLLIFPVILLHQLFINQRQQSADNNDGEEQTSSSSLSTELAGACWLYLGWCLHFLPFFLMGRALYVHHYYPALVFSSCLTGVLIDLALRRLTAALRLPLLALTAVLLAASFQLFSPLVYGFYGDVPRFENSSLHHLYWLNHWHF